jgi:hypothetical protein
MMIRRKSIAAAFALLAALFLLGGCAWPTHDPRKLKAIRAEAQVLMKTYPTRTDFVDVLKMRWPPVIARLEPELVLVAPDGVHILVKPYFDGGWGYFVPKNERELPDPPGRFSNLGQGVYWWHPY